MRAAIDFVVEFFTRKKAALQSAQLSAEARDRARRALALCSQRARSAETLWNLHFRSTALTLARGAFDAAQEARAAVLGEQGAEALALAWPSADLLDREVAREHTALFSRARSAWESTEREIRDRILVPGEILRQRIARGATTAVIGIAVIVFGVLYLVRPVTMSARGESYPGHPAQNAVDGDPSTEWLLPSNKTGKLEITFSRPRDIDGVKIINGRNEHYGDRAVKDYRLELRRDGKVLAATTGVFAAIEQSPQPVAVDLAANGVDQVIVEVTGFHKAGGGLAEVSFE
ncbi:MAG: discoidin domain-containing protein [Deltaproteobacteria bacterium]|nr:discoidin domain-containing protein [Deltaproteobacteria bacterium]